MQKIQKHLVSFGTKIHSELHNPVHDVLSWLAIAAVSASSFLIMTTVLAQTETINEPFNDPAFSTSTPSQPMPYNGAPCMPGTPCQMLENSFNGAPFPYPTGSSTPFMPTQNMQQLQPWGQPMAPQEGFMQKPPMGMENNMGFNQGPSEEDMKKMDEQRFEMMKKGFTRFNQEINRVKTQINGFKKKGLSVPVELKEALARIDEVAKKIKEAKNAEELDEVIGEFEESMDVVREWMPQLPRLAQYPKFIKQAEKEIIKVNKVYKSDVAKVKRAKLDLAEPLAEFKQAIEKQEALLKEIKELAKTEPGDALDLLHEEFFGSLDDMWASERIIAVSLNIRSGLTQMNTEIRQADATIKKLKRQKIDTKELEGLLADIKEQYGALKKLSAVKPIDTDAIIDAVDALMEIKMEFANNVQDLTGNNGYMPVMPKEQNFKFNLPQGYENVGGNMNANNDFSSQTTVK